MIERTRTAHVHLSETQLDLSPLESFLLADQEAVRCLYVAVVVMRYRAESCLPPHYCCNRE